MSRDLDVGIVGLGLIGGSLLRRLGQAGRHVIGFDLDEQTLEEASALGFSTTPSLEELASGADLVIVAVPPGKTPELVAECLRISESAVVADCASVKSPIVESVTRLAPKGSMGRYLAAHPLAGAETSGWVSSNEGLLQDAIWAVCPHGHEDDGSSLAKFSEGLSVTEPSFLFCSPSQHDQILAITSHATHILASVISASLARQLPQALALAAGLSGGALRDMTRVASSDFSLWSEIIELNEASVSLALGDWADSLGNLSESEDLDSSLGTIWSEGAETRALIDEIRWDKKTWEDLTLTLPPWERLIELSLAGRSTRRFTLEGNSLLCQVARNEANQARG